jgi:hypothetical protein
MMITVSYGFAWFRGDRCGGYRKVQVYQTNVRRETCAEKCMPFLSLCVKCNKVEVEMDVMM